MAYTIPPGNKVPMSFDGVSYTIPVGSKVALRFGGAPGTLFVAGFDASQFGSPAFGNTIAQLFPAGWDSGVTSGNLVLTKSLLATGIPAGAFGTARVYTLTQDVRLGGLNTFVAGTAWVSLGTRRLSSVAIGDASKFGTAVLAGGVRILDFSGRGIAPPVASAPVVWFLVREIFPAWFVATNWGKTLVDFQHNVDVEGFGGEEFGQAEVYRPRFIVDQADQGIRGTLWGGTTLRLAKQFVTPEGWIGGGRDAAEQFGRTQIFNLKQVLEQQFEVTPSDGGVFGDFNYVSNRIQVPKPDGLLAARYGTPDIRNAARIVATPAFIEFTVWGDSLVAPAIRTIRFAGTDTSAWGSSLGNIIYNDARVLVPAAMEAGAVGKPERVWSNQQTLRVVGDDASLHGAPMVDFAIRTLGVFSTSAPPPFGDANVSNWERYVSIPGLLATGAGVPTVEQHFTVIAAQSVLPASNSFGNVRVWNLTPELPVFGWSAAIFGGSAVHNQFETYGFESFGGETFGRHVVKDRRIFVNPGGIAPLPISQRHQVRNVTPDPPAPQNVSPSGFTQWAVPTAVFRTNMLLPLGFGPVTTFGTAQVVRNGVLPAGITPPYSEDSGVQCGIPSFNGTQFMSPGGIAAPSNADDPVADVGPRYVWAPQGYPYTTGYWKEGGQQMDASVFGIGHPERPVFGSLTVTHRDRALQLSGSSSLTWGMATIVQRPLYVRPTGTAFQRLGFPVLNGGGEVEIYGFDMSLFGSYAVNHAEDLGPRTIRPTGFAATTMSRQDVQNFNRSIAIAGFNAFAISAPVTPSWPRASTWISNAYPPFAIQGAEHLVFGNAWVSNYRRYVTPEGWPSAQVAEDTPGSFKDRMTVRKQGRVTNATIGDGVGIGTAGVSLWRHGVSMSGIEPLGLGQPAFRPANRVHPDGFDGLVFGDLQRWEAGKVKPHGDDLAMFGRGVLRRAIGPSGFVGVAGTPRLGAPVAPTGVDARGTGMPTLIAGWCGDRAIAIQEGPTGSAGIPTLEEAL